MTRQMSTFAEARAARSGVVGLVPTMGFLHEGHTALMNRARAECDVVVVSIFVNPLQFDEAADLVAYPRDLERDLALVSATGADVAFVPAPDEVYPVPPATRVLVDDIGDGLEGAHRPGHFAGVATVVAKLLAGIQPDRAYFGQKDAQQLALVTRMALDLSFPVEIVPCSTVREPDGLALSSRNVRLDAGDRSVALRLSRGLLAAADAAADGERSGERLENIVRQKLADLEPDYVRLADRMTAEPIDRLDRPSVLALACRIGDVRLIDNVFLEPDGSADRGLWLDSTSILYGDR